VRHLLVGLLALVPTSARAQFVPLELSRFDRQKVEWMLRERLPCRGCHRLEGQGGIVGPDLTAIADRRSAEFIFRMITNPQATLEGSRMPRVPMPSEWARLVASYLSEGRRAGTAPAAPTVPGDSTRLSGIRDAGALYQSLCAACHGTSGAGDGFNAGNLAVRPTAHADSVYMSSRPDDTLVDGVFSGGYILNKSHLMPAWGETLSREQIRGLVQYMRQLCRCAGPSWSRP
jgi:mono/diheme cytochrome c family protein